MNVYVNIYIHRMYTYMIGLLPAQIAERAGDGGEYELISRSDMSEYDIIRT